MKRIDASNNHFLKRTAREAFLWVFVACALASAAAFAVQAHRFAAELQTVATQLASTTEQMVIHERVFEDELSRVRGENVQLTADLAAEKQRMGNFEAQINVITGAVGTLEKWSKSDPQLLKKYSKVYFLNENYAPAGLSPIDVSYLYDKEKPEQFHTGGLPFLTRLFDAARAGGVNLQIVSAYRSFGEQATLKSSYRFTYGAGTANKFSADQGYSEHQLGTTVDVTVDNKMPFSDFEATPAYAWLTAHAYEYGFVLSYPEQNHYYKFEPWHWRFVGVGFATKLHIEGKYFYDLGQREIDQYLVPLFDPA